MDEFVFKPCPFCASQNLNCGARGASVYVILFVQCLDCGATGPMSSVNRLEACEKWNIRKELSE